MTSMCNYIVLTTDPTGVTSSTLYTKADLDTALNDGTLTPANAQEPPTDGSHLPPGSLVIFPAFPVIPNEVVPSSSEGV